VERLPPDIDTALRIDTTKAGFKPAFFVWGPKAGFTPAVLFGERPASRRPCLGNVGARVARLFLAGAKINFALHATFGHDPILWFRRLVGQ
jgi:hypothetical protein